MHHITTFTLLKYLRSKLSDDEARKLELHLSDCDYCTSELADLYQLEKELAGKVPDGLMQMLEQRSEMEFKAPKNIVTPFNIQEKKHSRIWFQFWQWKTQIAAGMLILLVVSSIIVWVWPEKQQVDEFRSDKVGNTIQATAPEEGAIVRQMPIQLRWTGIDQATGYRVTMYHKNGTQVLTQITKTSYFLISDTLQLEPDNIYLWQINALDVQNRILATDLFYFQFKPETNK